MTRLHGLPSIILIALLAPGAFGQTAGFEVASIHQGTYSTEMLHSGAIGMKIEGKRVVVRGWSLADLCAAAWRVRIDQVSGPDWLRTQRFDIQATIPQGASAAQVPEMLQALLRARFGAAFHHDEKIASVYGLTVGKGGVRFQPSAPGDDTPSGCATPVAGRRTCHRMTMGDLATLLSGIARMSAAMPPGALAWGIDFPVSDLTGLSGAYDFTMAFGPGSGEEGGGSVIDAVTRLGLKLDMQKGPTEVIVVDHMEKLPTEN